MKLKDLVRAYNFHDSSIVSMKCNAEERVLNISIEISALMQNSPDSDTEDLAVVDFVFHNSNCIDNPEQYYDAEILKCDVIEHEGADELHLTVELWLDKRQGRRTDTLHTLMIRAESVLICQTK